MSKGATLGEALSTANPTHVHHRRGRHALLHLLMLITTCSWAANIVAGKFVLRSMSGLALAQLRVTAAAAIFVLWVLVRRDRPSLRLGGREWGILGLTALFGITLNQICFIGGIGRTSAAHSALIVALGPVMVLIMAVAIRLEALTLLKVAGTAISLLGVAVLTMDKPSSGATLLGDMIVLAGSGVFAFYTILLKEVADRYDAVTLNALIFTLGAVFMAPFGGRQLLNVGWTTLPASDWWGLAFMISLGTVVSYIIYAFVLKELSAARVAAFAYLQPVVAIVLGIWVLAESVNWRVVEGGTAILVGVYLTEREGSERIKAEG